jgi:hypothetical protein
MACIDARIANDQPCVDASIDLDEWAQQIADDLPDPDQAQLAAIARIMRPAGTHPALRQPA